MDSKKIKTKKEYLKLKGAVKMYEDMVCNNIYKNSPMGIVMTAQCGVFEELIKEYEEKQEKKKNKIKDI